MKKLTYLIGVSLFIANCDIQASDLKLELLQRGNVIYAYDFLDHASKTGLASPVVAYKDLTLDVGGIRNIDESDEFSLLTGLSFHVGKFLGRKLGVPVETPNGLLEKLFLSAYFSPVKVETADIQIKRVVAHYGLYSGLEIRF